MTSTWDDEKIAALVGKGGDAGLALYGAFWRIAEIIASQMEGPAPSCAVSYPIWKWTRLLFVRKSYLLSVLLRLQKEGLIDIEGDLNGDGSVIVKMPNLLKYRDEYSRKSGHAPANVPPILDIDKEEEKHKKKKHKARSVPPEDLAGTLPLVDGTPFQISKSEITGWEEAFPAVDVRQQLNSMREWLKANPTKRKTPRGILKFIVGWLSREQDRGGSVQSNVPKRSALQDMVFANTPAGGRPQ